MIDIDRHGSKTTLGSIGELKINHNYLKWYFIFAGLSKLVYCVSWYYPFLKEIIYILKMEVISD